MNKPIDPLDGIDWSLTTWEGSRREQLRRWSTLTFDEILRAQEEMAELANLHCAPPAASDKQEVAVPAAPNTPRQSNE